MYIAEYNIHNKQDWGDIMKVEVGTVVGNLTVDSDSGLRKNRYTVWKCKCICGKEILLDTRTIQRGTVLDCGCLSHPTIKNWFGKRFGKLIVIKYVGKQKGVHWVV